MFNIKAKFEDTRIEASSDDGHVYYAIISSTSRPNGYYVPLTAQQLSDIMTINLHPDGTPEGYKQMYERLEPLFKGWDNELRPIP